MGASAVGAARRQRATWLATGNAGGRDKLEEKTMEHVVKSWKITVLTCFKLEKTMEHICSNLRKPWNKVLPEKNLEHYFNWKEHGKPLFISISTEEDHAKIPLQLDKKHCLYLEKTMISSNIFLKPIQSIHWRSKVGWLWLMFCSLQKIARLFLGFGKNMRSFSRNLIN